MRDVYIVSAVRTAIGSFDGSLGSISVTELGSVAVKEAVGRSGLQLEDVDELLLGQVLQAGCGLNPARQVVLKSGMPESVPGVTINKVCASGMKALSVGALSVAGEDNEITVAGGMESMTRAPYILPSARWGYRLGHSELLDVIQTDALNDPLGHYHMAITSENLTDDLHISREKQDEFAALSHAKAAAAEKAGEFNREIVPVLIPRRRGDPISFAYDESIRANTSVEVLARLKPIFKEGGTVTAGNASSINDGAAALVLCSEEVIKNRNLTPRARIVGYASAAVDPARMGLGSAVATTKVLKKTGMSLQDIEIIELNEAFAGQSLAVIQSLDLNPDITNIRGGAIALGHPVGTSGARIVVTLLHLMEDRQLRYGLAAVCVGGGQGMAMILERV